MILIVNKYLLGRKFKGISLWPFVVLRNRKDLDDPVFLNHERIHLKQQLELLVLPFYILYLTEFVIRYVLYKNAYKAYYNISFEREAYRNEFDLHYCKRRNFWAFMKYIRITT